MNATNPCQTAAPRRFSRRAALLLAGLCTIAAAPALSQEPLTNSLQPRVKIETTAGDFVIQLDTVRAPLTAENFLRYVRDGFYEGLLMHRVVANFVVQGGGYTPDFKERDTRAAIPNESGNGLLNTRGSVGMARGETPHSATSQFYVNIKDNMGLSPLPSRWGYAVFGQVVEGMDVIERIAYVATGERKGFGDTPLEPIVITRAVVVDEAPADEPAVSGEDPAPAEAPPPTGGSAAPQS